MKDKHLLRSAFAKIAAPLALAFTLAGCGESPQDAARKPAVIEDLVTQSVNACQTGPTHAAAADYAARLRAVLGNEDTADLDTIRAHNVTLCLDQRLSQQNPEDDMEIYGVLYPGQKTGPVASLWDNGVQPDAKSGFLGLFGPDNFAYYDDGDAVSSLAQDLRGGKAGLSGAPRYAGHDRIGRSHVTRWKDAADFRQGTVDRNKTPPLKAPSLKTSPAA